MITYAVINEKLAMEAFHDRIIVEEDPYRSGRECPKCDGKGHLGVQCKFCKGTAFYKAKLDEGSCPDCEVGTSDIRRSLGFELCPSCKGNGSSSIILTEDSQERPTTGVIKSVGALANKFKADSGYWDLPIEAHIHVGDRVAYGKFAGNLYELSSGKDKKHIRILKIAEVLTRLKGQFKQTPTEDTFKELTDVGVQA